MTSRALALAVAPLTVCLSSLSYLFLFSGSLAQSVIPGEVTTQRKIYLFSGLHLLVINIAVQNQLGPNLLKSNSFKLCRVWLGARTHS